MHNDKKTLLQWIEDDRDKFLSHFIQAESPNPPGDTRKAAAHLTMFLDAENLPYRVIAPCPEMPNILASFEGGAPGRDLVLNGHIDVFPVGNGRGWSYNPWSGAIVEGRIYGRGSCDMKCGTTASIFTFAYLHRMRDRLKGRLTLTAVSDEETFGPWGSNYLLEHYPEAQGDCCLNGEPGHPYALRFGERGLLWLAFTVHTAGAHGAYSHLSLSATKIAARLIADLEILSEIKMSPPDVINKALVKAKRTIDETLGQGASDIMKKVTVNIGTIHGGLKVNMIPGDCVIECDIRLPLGIDKTRIMEEVEKITTRYPEISTAILNHSPPNWCDPYGVMTHCIQENVKMLKGFEPLPVIAPGGTDCRLWRSRNIPAYTYGPSPHTMGSVDEYVDIEEFLHVVRTHVLSAYDYLNYNR